MKNKSDNLKEAEERLEERIERIEIKNYSRTPEDSQELEHRIGLFTATPPYWSSKKAGKFETLVKAVQFSSVDASVFARLKQCLPTPRLVIERNPSISDLYLIEVWIDEGSAEAYPHPPKAIGQCFDASELEVRNIVDRIAEGLEFSLEKQARNLRALNSYHSEMAGHFTEVSDHQIEYFFEISESWEHLFQYSSYGHIGSFCKKTSAFQLLENRENSSVRKNAKLDALFN